MGPKEVMTSCTCDCPDTCSIIATVGGDRVIRIRGNSDFPPTRGFLCRRSRGFLKRLFSSERVLHPMRKKSLEWERIGWDEACGVIADKIDTALHHLGPLSVFYFQDAGSLSALKLLNHRFFNLLGGGTFASGSLCGGAGIAGQTQDFGVRTSHDPFDLLNSKMVVIWGRNPAWTNVHLMPILLEARRRGACLVVIDPVRTATSRIADLHVSLKPGTDAVLALGIAKVIVDEGLVEQEFVENHTRGYQGFLLLLRRYELQEIGEIIGVTVEEIRELAMLYGRSKPAAIIGGWGLQRWKNGANTYRLLDALGAITGNIGITGGGVNHGMDQTRWFDRSVCLTDNVREHREIPRPQTGKGLVEAKDPPIKVAVVTGANPVNQCPNSSLVRKGFEQIDFVVVIDMFMTDTARVADIVLPTTHFLQEKDIVGSYWHNYVMPVNIAQERLGEEKTDLEIFSLIGQRLGIGSQLRADPEYYLEQIIAPLKAEGVNLGQIMAGPICPPSAIKVPFGDRAFPTPSKRFEFVQELIPIERCDDGSYGYHLLSPHPHQRTHSQLVDSVHAEIPAAFMSPVTAGEYKVKDGDRVVVRTSTGSLGCVVRVTECVRSDTVMVYEGWWEQLGGSVNRLTSDALTDQGLCATYYDVMCTLMREEP